MGDFRFFRPTELQELLEFKAREGSRARILDGGSNVLVYINEGSISGGTLVDVRSLVDAVYPIGQGLVAMEHAATPGTLKVLLSMDV